MRDEYGRLRLVGQGFWITLSMNLPGEPEPLEEERHRRDREWAEFEREIRRQQEEELRLWREEVERWEKLAPR